MFLYILPALLGLGLFVGLTDDDDDQETASDGEDTRPAGTQVPDGVDDYRGTEGDDLIYSRDEGGAVRSGGGDDTVLGGEGDDSLYGSSGDDSLRGEAGEDALFGGAGNDTLDTGSGNDTAVGDAGDDRIRTRAGDDAINAGSGDDTVFAGDGNDTVNGSTGDDWIDLGAGDDNATAYGGITGYAGNDTIMGGLGDDLIADTSGQNVLSGDEGDDTIRSLTLSATYPDATGDTVDGGAGDDILDVDDGDQVTGGEGADRFVVWRSFHQGDEDAVTLTDFDTSEDMLLLEFPFDSEETYDIDVSFDAEQDSVIVAREGEALAVLQGLSETDIPDIRLVLPMGGVLVPPAPAA